MHNHSHVEKNPIHQKITLSLLIVLGVVFYLVAAPRFSQNENFLLGEVLQIDKPVITQNDLFDQVTENVKIQLLNGANKGQQVEAEYSVVGNQIGQSELRVGEKVAINVVKSADEVLYQITDKYRLPALFLVLVSLFIAAVVFAGWMAVDSFLALTFSVLILIYFIVDFILSGWNPLLVTIVGALLISTVSVYLGHGVKKRTTIAVAGIILTLTLTGVLSIIFVKMAHLIGMGSEEAFYLQLDAENSVNLQGILLAGIIIGTLGILDDITTAQVTIVDELHKANPALSRGQVYKSALSVGKEHIAALINTLVLAYAGASLPLFILFVSDSMQPLWALLNSEFIAEEIMRTLIGSIALVLSVPITTMLAVRFLIKNK